MEQHEPAVPTLRGTLHRGEMAEVTRKAEALGCWTDVPEFAALRVWGL